MSTVAITPSTDPDEWFAQTEPLKHFVDQVQSARSHYGAETAALLGALEAPFKALLADSSWLPDEFSSACTTGGMGGGIGQWLLFRDADRSLTLFTLVVPPGSETPVHDHHAWGLVGLYRGEQSEAVYHRETPVPDAAGNAPLTLVETRLVRPGDTYQLLPPADDVHSVRTVSDVPSVSIHLLGTDAGCLWRHRFEPESAHASAFRSGYTNVDCPEESEPPVLIVCAE